MALGKLLFEESGKQTEARVIADKEEPHALDPSSYFWG
jgi:hypothetical protein